MYGKGTVFELSPSNQGWTKRTLYDFQGDDGWDPVGGLVFDRTGNLYGTTFAGGTANGGVVYKLTPSSGGWTESVIWNATMDSGGPYDSPTIDADGNLYVTTMDQGVNFNGNIFKLTPSGSGWIYTDLHDLYGVTDGEGPWASPTLDTHGNIFGTTVFGGYNGGGTVYQITP